MVEDQIRYRGIYDTNVLEAMSSVPRHIFANEYDLDLAYADTPLPVGYGQTISQPYIVAYMTEAAMLKNNDRVLEIGTGSGYQSAILSRIVKEVYTIEIIGPLGENAKKIFKENGYKNIHVRIDDGYKGWQEVAPFDAIIITAAPKDVPQELLKQLKVGGRMIIPVGVFIQELFRLTKTDKKIIKENLLPVRFVPMVDKK